MPEVPLQLGPVLEPSYEELAGASPSVVNAVVDQKGAVRRRPGLSVSSTVTDAVVDASGVYGLHAAQNGTVFATAGLNSPGGLYKLTPSSSVALGGPLYFTGRPQFAETEAIVVFSGLSAGLRRVDLAAPHATSLLGGSPPAATQIIAHGGRLLADDPDWNGRIAYSAPAAGSSTAGHEQWSAVVTALGRSGFFTAEARPDKLVALRENSNEIAAFGATSTQFFGPDASLVYAALSTKEYGCSAASSVLRDEETYAWLDHRRRFVISNGREYQEIGAPIRSLVEALSTVDDCFGFRVLRRFFDGYVWVFPSDGLTLAFQKGVGWAQWNGWANGNYAVLPWTAQTTTVDNDTLIGTSSGTIRALDFDSQTDDGEMIPFSVTTGFQNHGTEMRKVCNSLRIVLRRGVHASNDAEISVEYRDKPGSWSAPRRVGLGATGDVESVIQLRGLGVYRRRQWRITATGTEALTIAGAVEEVTPLVY